MEGLSEASRGLGERHRSIAERNEPRRPQPGWLSDADAQTAIKLGEARNLAVHMYREDVCKQIEQRLAEHAALLHRWLDAMKERASE